MCSCGIWIFKRLNNSKARGDRGTVSHQLLWSVSCLLTYDCAMCPISCRGGHCTRNISMEMYNDLVRKQRVMVETCSASRLSDFPGVLSVSRLNLIRLSLYESSIRSSALTRYGSLVFDLSHSTTEKLCVKSPVLLLHIFGFSSFCCHPEELEGDLSFVAELQCRMQCFSGWFSQRACERGRRGGCSTAYSTSYHIGRLPSRKGGWQAATLSLHQDFIADGMLKMLSYLDAERLNNSERL